MPSSGSGPDVQVHKMNVAVLRFLVFMLITTFIVVGPIYRQAFGGTNKIFKNWIMFSYVGLGIVDARFSLVLDNGSEVLLDRYEVLGLSRHKNNKNPKSKLSRLKMNLLSTALSKSACPLSRQRCGGLPQGKEYVGGI